MSSYRGPSKFSQYKGAKPAQQNKEQKEVNGKEWFDGLSQLEKTAYQTYQTLKAIQETNLAEIKEHQEWRRDLLTSLNYLVELNEEILHRTPEIENPTQTIDKEVLVEETPSDAQAPPLKRTKLSNQ